MLPSMAGAFMFPLNAAAWSLFYEMAINAVYAGKLLLSRRSLLVVAVLSGIGIVMQTCLLGSVDQGA